MTARPVRAGILGCGMVADEYATTLNTNASVHLTACADLNHEQALAFAARHDCAALPVDTLLNPQSVDLLVILTPPRTHAELAEQAITARIPAVWVEKPVTTDPRAATALIAQAAKAGTLLGVAPDTLLGPALETAAAALRDGLIGDVRSAAATLLSTGPERWHPSPAVFYAQHAGPLGDMGPYYLSALDFLLGPLQVSAATARRRAERRIRSGPHAGQAFSADAPTYVAALLETGDSVPVTLTASFDAAATHTPHLEIHGTKGTLVLPDPNFHDGEILHRPYGSREASALPQTVIGLPSSRGAGVLDLAEALREERAPLCTAERAARTVHLTHAILHAASPSLPAQPPRQDTAPTTSH
ncbi:Gfo/Idh/MocA family oxidoreductase [Streptomyces sp. NBC_01142]|uniref:Gfo/Idh/MocA family protein n=1 Tax=Streptomyces sp. NBC_01142 TaxID=2975865 RepID=UPI002259B5AF|nr:Gfo/Idh/MocA family oxidoreductase [Streptomyces sp. NBC_01142]MCX4826461.1 Gfo/Idh/MocA family oxidoreductase [Streptomyces sp. NBC_01142]